MEDLKRRERDNLDILK